MDETRTTRELGAWMPPTFLYKKKNIYVSLSLFLLFLDSRIQNVELYDPLNFILVDDEHL